MKKRLFAILLALGLLAQLFPLTASAVRVPMPHPSSHCVCGGNHQSINGHTSEEVVYFTKDGKENPSGDLSNMNAIQSADDFWTLNHNATNNKGKTFYYYLANDVTITKQVNIADDCTVVICLHGHTLTCNMPEVYGAFNLWNNARLVFTDCQFSGDRGLITGDTPAAVYVPKTSTFELYGVSICMTSSETDGIYNYNQSPVCGVYNDGTFNMYGGCYYVKSDQYPTNRPVIGNIRNTKYGPGVVNTGTFNMYDGIISGNERNGVISTITRADDTINLYGGTITGNIGAGISATHWPMPSIAESDYYTAINLYGGTISENTSVGIDAAYGRVTMAQQSSAIPAEIKNNKGGAISLSRDGSTAKLGTGTITGNSGGKGAVALTAGSLTLTDDVNITGNTGANLYLANGKTVTLDKLGRSALIGITTETAPTKQTPIVFADACDTDYRDFFFADDTTQKYAARYNSAKQLELSVVQTYVLTFDPTGGTGGTGTIFRQDPNFTIPNTPPTRDAYHFLGWADAKDADAAQYHPGDAIVITEGTEKTLYAVWKPHGTDDDSDGICDFCDTCLHEKDEEGYCTDKGCAHNENGRSCCPIKDPRIVIERESGYSMGIGKSYDGSTEGDLREIHYTDGTNQVTLTNREERANCVITAAYDTPDAGDKKTVTVTVTLIGEAAQQYKFANGTSSETFTIWGYINKAIPKPVLSLDKTEYLVDDWIYEHLSVTGVMEDAEVTYRLASHPMLAGSSEYDSSNPQLFSFTRLTEAGEFWVYATTAETANYQEGRTAPVKIRVRASCTVHFESNGGFLSLGDRTRSVPWGSAYGTLPAPYREDGYDFVGWYTASEGGERIYETSIMDELEEQTLYAQWAEHGTDSNGDGICDICDTCLHEKDDEGYCTVKGCKHSSNGRDCCPKPPHTHLFDQEIAEAEYLVSPADCLNDAVYYKSCACGEAGTETFVKPNTAFGHEWGKWAPDAEGTHKRVCTHDASHFETAACTYGDWNTNRYSHWKTCGVCGGETELLNHSDPNDDHFCDTCGKKISEHDFTGEIAITELLFKEANCLSPAIYYKSCKICLLSSKGTDSEATFEAGEKDPNNHAEYPGEWQADADSHWRFYTCCHLEVDRGAHQGGTADCLAPALCETCFHSYGELGPHHFVDQINEFRLKSAATCTSPAVYYQSCSTCAAQGPDTFELGKPLGHDWGAWTSNGDGTHTRVCTRDTAHTESDSCSGGTATCTEKAVCATCGSTYGETAAHHFTAEAAEEQYLKSEATCTGKAIYYKSCAACGLTSKGTADEATFASGDVLGHDWGAWTSNGDGTHTRVCTRDTAHTESNNCSGGTATCTEKAVCTTCGGAYGETNPEHHAEGCTPEWSATESEHEQRYSLCGKVLVMKEAHTFGDWTVTQAPTPRQDGEQERTCEICAYKQTQMIPATGEVYHTITASAGVGGSISPAGEIAVPEGTSLTFTFTPDKRCAVADVTVDGVSIGAVQTYTFENVDRAHTITVSFVRIRTFVDVPEGSYYEEAVDWAEDNGITNGTDATHFSPDAFCTRAQAVTFLWRTAGSPAPKTDVMPFTDVPAGSYYYNAVLWAVENGITLGTSTTTFSPEDTCTRAHIVTFLWRFEQCPAAGGANPFSDVSSRAYYAGAVLWAVERSITNGTSENTFSPDDACTRAQIVTFLWRCKK